MYKVVVLPIQSYWFFAVLVAVAVVVAYLSSLIILTLLLGTNSVAYKNALHVGFKSFSKWLFFP